MNDNQTSIGNVIVIGLQGEGKSSLINILLGKEVAKVAREDEVLGETVTITKLEGNLFGTESRISLFDVPGYGNLKLNDAEILEMWKNNFSNIEVKAILYVASLTRNRIFASDIYLLEIARLLFHNSDGSSNVYPPVILVGSNADKVENLETQIKSSMQSMVKEINTYSALKIKDSIIVSTKINNTSEIKKLHSILINSVISARTRSYIVIDVIKTLLKENMSRLGYECFSSEAFVNKKTITGNVVQVKLKDLEIGDEVECEGGYERVLTKTSHSDKLKIFKTITIKAEKGIFIELSGNHYLHCIREGHKQLLTAQELTINDKIITKHSDLPVSIEEIRSSVSDHMVNIRTPSTTVYVNDVLASCLVRGDGGSIGQNFLLFVNKFSPSLPQAFNKLCLSLQGYKYD